MCNAMVQTSDGGFALAGHSYEDQANRADACLARVDADGDSLWMRIYGGRSWGNFQALIQTPDGGFALAANFSGIDGNVLLRVNENGDSLWAQNILERECSSIILTSEGGFALADMSGRMTVTDDMGAVLWSRILGVGSLYSMIQTSDGGFAVAASLFGNDFTLCKADQNGDTLWLRTFRGVGGCIPLCLVQTNDDGFVLAGWANCADDSYADLWLVRTGADGDTIWTRTFNDCNNSGQVRLVQTAEDGLAFTGGGFLITRLDEGGNVLWSQSYGSGGCTSLIQTSGGEFAMGGNFSMEFPYVEDFYLVKTDADPESVSRLHPALCTSFYSPPYPNPFNSTTRISFRLPQAGDVKVKVYDLSGRAISTLVSGNLQAGNHEVIWQADGMVSGLYLVKMEAEGFSATKKVALVK